MSLAELLASRPRSEREAWLASLTNNQIANLQHEWSFWGRPSQFAPAGDWRTWLILAGRGFGKTRTGAEWVRQSIKQFPLTNIIAATADDARDIMVEGEALALDTPIPTPDGWMLMGSLSKGDWVFDETGDVCQITWASGIATDRPCYRVLLSDGEEIVADAQHKWLTHTRAQRHYAKAGSVVTTEEMAATLVKDGWNNHAIRLPGPVQHPAREYAVHPYVLGAWLGDGRNRGGDFTSEDDAIPLLIEACGYRVTKHASHYAYRIRGIDPTLRALGLVGNKHIPLDYLTGSVEQRLALLQGLMDTDGYVSERGQCAYDGNNLRLLGDVRDLVRSLGMTCRAISKPKSHNHFPEAAPMFRLTFTPTMQVCQLPRKVARIRPISKKASWRMVTAVDPCPSVPVRCIAVDSRSHLFLAGRGYVPTHNSGILAICPKGERPEYRASMRRLEWPNGARSLIFTADEPERLRGKQHMRLWADECAAWRYPEAWDQAMFGLRIGSDPRAVVTTTPKPIELVRRLLADPNTHVTRGSTYENRGNLAPAFFEQIIRRYEGTRIGRQELNAEVLDDIEGALWTHAMIDAGRVASHPDLVRIGVGVDPSGGATEGHDEQGIIVAGLGIDGDGYVLADRSCRLSPDGWGRRVVQAFVDYQADVVFVEKNYGGDMAISTIETASRAMSVSVPITAVSASRGKVVRAEPVAALYEQGKVHHVGTFSELEDQLCSYVPGLSSSSPDRMDALVWVATEVLLQGPVGVWTL